MKLPWITPDKSARNTDGNSEHFAFASRFEVANLGWSLRFMNGTIRMVNQMRKAPGCVTMSLDAKFFKGIFYTASVWSDEESLRAFYASEPHLAISKSLAPAMRKSAFRYWSIDDSDLPLDWKTVNEILDSPQP